MIVSVLAVPKGVFSRALSVRPLVLIGVISYGIYLWHFPVIAFVNTQTVGLDGFALLVVRFSITIGLAAASFVLVERPVMRGTFWRSIKSVLPAGAMAMATLGVIWVGTEIPVAAAGAHAQRYRQAAGQGSGTGAPPGRVVVLGDSTALTLGVALIATAPKGTKVVNGGLWGCGLAIGANSSNAPTPELPMFPACNESEPAANLWPALDRKTVEGTAPGDVVLLATGHWDTQDLLMHGRWSNILSPSFRRYEAGQLRTFIGIASAHGAHVDLLTMPPMERDYPWLGNSSGAYDIASSPARRRLFNELLRQTAAEFPSKVSVIDYGAMLSPSGRYTQYLDGVQVRSSDGVHTPSYDAGQRLRRERDPERGRHVLQLALTPAVAPDHLFSGGSGIGREFGANGYRREFLTLTVTPRPLVKPERSACVEGECPSSKVPQTGCPAGFLPAFAPFLGGGCEK